MILFIIDCNRVVSCYNSESLKDLLILRIRSSIWTQNDFHLDIQEYILNIRIIIFSV